MGDKTGFLSLENHKIWQTIFFILVLLAMVFLLYQYIEPLQIWVDTCIEALFFDYGLDYGEGPLLDQAVRLSHFQNIYQPIIDQPPYTITNYTPLYPLIQTPFVWAFGPQLWYGRLISEVATLVTAVFIGLIIHKLTNNIIAAIISGCTFLIFPFVIYWSVLARVDSLALAFSMVGLYFLAIDPTKRKNRIWSAVFIVAAVYTKQSFGLAAPFAAFLFLLKDKPRKKAFEYAGMVAVLGLLIMGLMMILTKGGFFFHVFRANVNPFVWDTVKNYKNEMLTHFPLFFWLAGLYLLGGIWKGMRQNAWWMVAPYVLTGIAVGVTVGKEGSNVNYFYELCAALSLLTGALIGLAGDSRHYLWVQLVMMIALSFPIQGAINRTMEEYINRHPNRMLHVLGLSRMEQAIDAVEGNVLADEFMDMVVTAGKPLQFQPFEYKMLEGAGVWDQTDFVRAIENQEFDLILLYDPPYWDSRNGRWTPEQLEAIETYYRSYRRNAETLIYYPKP